MRKRDVFNIGEKYNRWEVIGTSENNNRNQTMVLCRCECGTIRTVRATELKRHKSKSCGCLNMELRKSRNGINSPTWNHNITEEERQHKREHRKTTTPEYMQWRTKVFYRDNYTCQHCGQVGGKLQPHHIYPWRDYPQVRYAVWNGITLCKECHKPTIRKEQQVSHMFVQHLRKYME